MLSTEQQPFQVLSDGKKLYLITGDQAYICDDPLLTQMSFVIDNPVSDMYTVGSRKPVGRIQGQQTVRIDMSFIAREFSFQSGKNLMIDLDIFRNHRIVDLFKIINKKIDGGEKQ